MTKAVHEDWSSTLRTHGIGIALALVAGLHKGVLAAFPTNDDFMHRTYAQQVLGGQLPIRDFFDYGMVLMYALSAVAEQALGHRLLAEAAIIGVATGISALLVYRVVLRNTGSLLSAVLATLAVLVAGPRGFSYPKLIIYAVAASLWWAYVHDPRARIAAALGAWTAIAYYWRPDHGFYVAIGVALAMIAVHGPTLLSITRCLLAGAVAVALVLPFWVFAATETGFVTFVRSGVTAAVAQHAVSQAGPRWPMRELRDWITVDDVEEYAPRIGIRWSRNSSVDERRAVVARYQLALESSDDPESPRVRLSSQAVSALRDLVDNPIVDDTSGVVRSSATLPWSTWPVWDRWRFRHAWLRVHLFAGVDEHTRAGAVAHVLLYGIALVAMVIGLVPSLRRFLPEPIRGAQIAWFAAFAIVVNLGLIRTPYEVRASDAIILPAILFGFCLAAASQSWTRTRGSRRWLMAGAALCLALLFLKSIAVTGEFGTRVSWLAGEWRSPERARGAWQEARSRLWTTPPSRFWQPGSGPLSVRLGEYARACVAPSQPILVLWFAPEIYYYADRQMGGRHLHFTPAFRRLGLEQQFELDKVRLTAPPVVFASSDLEAPQAAFPAMVEYVDRSYHVAASFTENGGRYQILVRRDREPTARYGEQQWPCYR